MNHLGEKIINATKWSIITEIAAKLIVPITNMILARILAPEAFGVIATITMIISFADMFTDAGFQKYLVQHEFENEQEKYQHANVAFWTNLIISFLLWLIIGVYRDLIAILVGNPGLGNTILVACISLPLTSFSSIQMSLYRRDFDYKTLFYVRLVGIFVPVFVTIPLAILGFSYWALIIGTVCGNLANAIILTMKSKWKPTMFYRFSILKEMIGFSFWSLIEAISIWLTNWIDTFIVGSILSTYYLGIYKTAPSTVGGIMGLVTSTTMTILFSSLSRLQNDEYEYKKTLFKFQKIVGIFVLPMGVGIFVYREFITSVLLGSQWSEASTLIGLWGLTSSFMILFGSYCSEVYRSKGKPQLSFLAQILHLIVLIPICYFTANESFESLVWARSLVRIQLVVVHFIIMHFVIKISPWIMIKNNIPSMICSILMWYIADLLITLSTNFIWQIISIFICIIMYFIFAMLFSTMRKEIFNIVNKNIPIKYI